MTNLTKAIDQLQEVVKSIPYQLCPKCNGTGTFYNSMHATTNLADACDVCNGAKIIPQYIVPISDNPSYAPVSRESELLEEARRRGFVEGAKFKGMSGLEFEVRGTLNFNNMDNNKPENPYVNAFKSTMDMGIDGLRNVPTENYGLTLRDHYAGLAMQGMLADSKVLDLNIVAKQSFDIADMMLAEREKNR